MKYLAWFALILTAVMLSSCGDTDVRPEHQRVGALLDSVSAIAKTAKIAHGDLDEARKLLVRADSLLSAGNNTRAQKLVAQAEISIRIAVVRAERVTLPPDSSREGDGARTPH
jgi:hypothetical protein